MIRVSNFALPQSPEKWTMNVLCFMIYMYDQQSLDIFSSIEKSSNKL